MRSFLIFAPLARAFASTGALPSWAAPQPDPHKPLAGYVRAANTTTSFIFWGTPSDGAYNHAAMIAYSDGVITASWKNGIGASGEDAPGQRVKYAQSVDGLTWTPAAMLFENMTTPNLPVALFAGPFALLRGNLYASATPAVIATGDAQGSQFCLWPDGLDPRNAGPPGQKQPVGTLMLRRILPGVGRLGPAFWVSPAGIPAGFGLASAAAGVLLLNETDAETQADVATLLPSMPSLPCADPLSGGTLKCEACLGGCQIYASLSTSLGLANERAHWNLPQGAGDAIVYRSHAGALYASVRPPGSAKQTDWPPVALTDIPNDDSNINAGTLPDGRVYLVSNPLPHAAREPLTVAMSTDGLSFDAVLVVLTCTDTGAANSTCKSRNNVGGGIAYPQALTVVPPAPASLQGFYVIASNNKEDILVSKTPFTAL
jgi:hypothetical protein